MRPFRYFGDVGEALGLLRRVHGEFPSLACSLLHLKQKREITDREPDGLQALTPSAETPY